MSGEKEGVGVCGPEGAHPTADTRQDVGYTLAANVASLQYEQIPDTVVDTTKKIILDTLGTIIGGSGAGAGVKEVVDLVRLGGGTEDSSVFGHNLKTNTWSAAFALGAMAHALDYDNVHDDAFTHPSSSTIPAALAVAEFTGASGQEFLTAMTLGDDLHCRLAYSLSRINDPERQGLWMPPLVLGGFAAAAVSARLLGLDQEKTVNAFGITLTRTGGPLEIVIDPGALRGLYAAFPAMTGVLSAFMAYKGIPGIKTCFEGKAGLYNTYFRGLYDRESLTRDLGLTFEGAGVSFKPWPSCRFTNAYVDATLQIVREHNISPENIAEIRARYEADNVKNCCEPIAARQRPQSPPEAKLSLPFTIAMAAVLRKMEIGDFSLETIKSEELLKLATKVIPVYDKTLKSTSKTMLPAVVEIMTDDGSVFSKRVDLVYGHPQNPMSWEDIINKFKDCASYGAKPIQKKDLDKVVDLIQNLEKVSNMLDVINLVR
ncbi:MAG TPA: MmgE/PrpD family protein [Syntrophorhabdaceae bacterium]|nr:MmgE/PrpD family protein [Syntrophorhabdaceae bacterium]